MKKKVLLAGVLMVLVGCGGGGGGGGANLDPKDVAEKAKHPTGTLTQENVDDVVNEFVELLTAEEGIPSVPGGLAPQTEYCYGDICCDVTENSVKCDCSVSGSVSAHVPSGCTSDCTIEYSYNNCAFDEECAIDGDGAVWMSSLTGGEMAYSFSGTVCGQPVDIAYYFDGTDMWYVVEVNEETFAVRGEYSNGYGWVYIKDSTGEEYHCTIVNDEVTCEGL